jgi:hypothetical protein
MPSVSGAPEWGSKAWVSMIMAAGVGGSVDFWGLQLDHGWLQVFRLVCAHFGSVLPK